MKNYKRYLYALLAVPVVVLTRYALLPLTGGGIPFITLFPATVAIALVGGMGPAILTGVLGVLLSDYFFVEPLHSWDFGIEFLSRTAVVVLTSVFVGYVGAVLRQARARAEKQTVELHESREDLKRAQTVALTGSWRLDVRKDVLSWSDEAYRIFGVPTGTPLTYELFLSYIHPDDRRMVEEKWQAALKGAEYDVEHRIVVDDHVKWVREKAELEYGKDGALVGGFGTVTDTTERKKREDTLHQLNRTLRALTDTTQAMMRAKDEARYVQDVCDIIVKDCGHKMVWVGFAENDEEKSVRPVAYAGFDKSYVETLDVSWADVPRGRGPTGTAIRTGETSLCKNMLTNPAFEPWREDALKRGNASSISLPLMSGRTAFGALTIYSTQPDPFSDDEINLLKELTGDLAYGISAIRSRIARDEAQKALQESEQRYRELVQYANSAIIRWNRNGQITLFNEYAQSFFGYSENEVLGGPVDILLPRSSSDEADPSGLIQDIVKSPERYVNNINENVCKDGRRVWMAWTNRPAYDENGQLSEILAIGTDITKQKQAEETLHEERDFITAVLDTAGALVVVLDEEGRIRRFNHECERITGYASSEVVGRAFWEFLVPEDDLPGVRQTWEKLRAGDFPNSHENHWVSKDGSQCLISWANTAITRPDGRIEYVIATGVDITERKQAEEALRQQAQLLHLSYDAIIVWREDGSIEHWNRGAEQLYGYTESEALGRVTHKLLKTIHSVPWPEIEDEMRKHGQWEGELRHFAKDGHQVTVSARHQLVLGTDGIERILETNRDITQRKQMEEELRKSRDELEVRVKERTAQLDETVSQLQTQVKHRIRAEQTATAERQRFNDVLETLPAYICLLTPDYYMPFANKVFRDLFGYHPDKKCYEFLFNRAEPCEDCQTYKVLETNEPQHWEWSGPNGKVYDVYDFPFKDSDGSQLILEMGIDITERKQAETALHAASRYARGLLEASLDPLVTISSEGKITDVNEATVKATGVAREQLIGTEFSSYFTESDKAEEGYQRVFAEGFVTDYPLTVRHKDGRLIDVLYNATVYKNEAGEVQGIFAAARDITEKKAAEAELEKYRLHLEDLVKQRTNELARSNKDLEQFAYVASHDLQEPLRAVSGFVTLLQNRLKDALDEKTTEYMDFTVDGVKRMQTLINGLLAYSRIDTRGKPPERTDSNKSLEEALLDLQTSIRESDAEITFDSLPTVHIDPVQLTQLFQNLISNAIKFRSELRPEIHVSAVRSNRAWQFAVKDNGIGLDPEYRERIFMIFQRLHTRKKYPGTGIGLSLCKKIVERHGGRIWVESEQGRGSTFYFTVPDMEGAEK
ncbi:MAG: PAS domain S-box protein [Sedimentisphaerales bacterium]